MNLENLKSSLKAWLLKQTLNRLDLQTVRNICTYALDLLKQKTDATENVLDDWAVEAFEALLADDGKMTRILDYLKTKIGGNLCQSAAVSAGETDELAALAESIVPPCDGAVCEASATGWAALLLQALQVVIPEIIEWVKSQKSVE